MQSSKSKSKNQIETRQFKVAVVTDPEVAYSDGEETQLGFDVFTGNGEAYEVYIDLELFGKRMELFCAGHRLVLVAETDNFSPILYATDAWFDRDCDCREGRAK